MKISFLEKFIYLLLETFLVSFGKHKIRNSHLIIKKTKNRYETGGDCSVSIQILDGTTFQRIVKRNEKVLIRT